MIGKHFPNHHTTHMMYSYVLQIHNQILHVQYDHEFSYLIIASNTIVAVIAANKIQKCSPTTGVRVTEACKLGSS